MIVCNKCDVELKYEWADCGSEATEDWLECPECEQYFETNEPYQALDENGKRIPNRRAINKGGAV